MSRDRTTMAVVPHRRFVTPLVLGLSLSPLVGWGLVGASSGCKDHSGLAPDPDAATSSSHSSSAAGTSTGTGGDAGTMVVEPDGPTKLTLVDGIIDEPAAAFCFVDPEGAGDRPPIPQGGLDFGTSMVVPLPSEDIPDGDALLVIITGDVGSIGTATCGQLTADPGAFPDAVVLQLGLLPEGTLTAKRSLLFAPMGCVGGVDHDAPQNELICGKGYTPDNPTLSLVAGPLSRVKNSANVSMQGVNATTVFDKVDLYFRPGKDGFQDQLLVEKLSAGSIGPFPPSAKLNQSELGNVDQAQVGLSKDPSAMANAKFDLTDVLTAGGLTGTDLGNGGGVAFVAVGADPAAGDGAWWNGLTFVGVDSDPE